MYNFRKNNDLVIISLRSPRKKPYLIILVLRSAYVHEWRMNVEQVLSNEYLKEL